MKKIKSDFEGNAVDWAKYWNERGLEVLEKILEDCAGEYCYGDEVTLADAVVFPQLYAADTRFKIKLENYDKIFVAYQNLQKHPDIIAARPE